MTASAARSARQLEVIVLSVDEGVAAEQGGATRLEVVREIEAEGLTPEVALVERLLARVTIPLRVMIRPRNAFVLDDEAHRDEVRRDAARFADLPVDLVTGYVRAQGAAQSGISEFHDCRMANRLERLPRSIDHSSILRFSNSRRGTPVGAQGGDVLDLDALALVTDVAPRAKLTVHRAIERVAPEAWAQVRACPHVDRVLSGGGAGDWTMRARTLASLQTAVDPVVVVVGGGVDRKGIDILAPCETLRELHVGRLARADSTFGTPVDAHRVSRLRRLWIG